MKRDDTLNELTILSLLIGSRFIDLITYVWSVVIMAVIKWLFQDWSVLSINCRAIKINDSELGLTEFLLYKNHENMSVSQCFTRKMSWYKKVNSTGNWPFYNLPNALPLINRVALLRMWKNTTLISQGNSGVRNDSPMPPHYRCVLNTDCSPDKFACKTPTLMLRIKTSYTRFILTSKCSSLFTFFPHRIQFLVH